MNEEKTGKNANFEIIIKPTKGLSPINFKELWDARELLVLLILRDIQAKYRQSVLGFTWAFIPLFVQMVIFTIIFGRVAKLGPEGIPYPLFSYAALLPWSYFSRALGGVGGSLLKQSGLFSKVYFPRMLAPLIGVFAALVDFMIAFVFLVVLMIWYEVVPSWSILFLPCFILIAMLTALGCGLWLTTLAVKYRDVNFITPFLIQIWMYVTPVIFAIEKIPEKYQIFLWLNPMTGVIEGFRWAILGQAAPNWVLMSYSWGVMLLILISGAYYFRRMEKTFVDII